MKKAFTVEVVSFVFLLICSFCCYMCRYLPINNPWIWLGIGLCVLLISGVVAAFSCRIVPLNIFCFFVSAIALGFCIRAWYVFRGFDNSPVVMLLVSLAAALYLVLFYLLSRIPIFLKNSELFIVIFLAISLITYVILILTTKTTYISTFGYYMLIELAFIFAMYSEITDVPELIRKITLSTYSVFAVLVFIAVLIIIGTLGGDADCDCDCECLLDCCELDFDIKNKNKKAKRR